MSCQFLYLLKELILDLLFLAIFSFISFSFISALIYFILLALGFPVLLFLLALGLSLDYLFDVLLIFR